MGLEIIGAGHQDEESTHQFLNIFMTILIMLCWVVDQPVYCNEAGDIDQ